MAANDEPQGAASSVATVAAGDDVDSFDAILKQVVRAPAPATSGPPELPRGTVFAGRFTIERVLGVGGMGTVYVARDASLGREVAIKVHHAPGGGVRLRREAIAMARLAHPNVVTVFEVGELEQRPFVVMELVTGTTLRDWLRAAPRSVREVLDTLIATGEGLAAAHDAGLVHRDIKPENVLIASDGRPRVGDFGLARELDSHDDPPVAARSHGLGSMTQTGAVLGTPAYMAPEQFAGSGVDARADQFAFCVTAWEALWKERPFSGATFEELVVAVTKGPRRIPPSTPKVPARVRAALERGLSTDPAARFPSLHALLDELREPRRRRRKIAVAMLATGAALGVAGYFAMSRASAPSCGDPGDPGLPHTLPGRLLAITDAPGAERVEFVIDRMTAQYKKAKRFACEELEVRHAWSPELAAKSNVCVAIEIGVAKRLLSPAVVTTATSYSVVYGVTIVRRLDPCTDPVSLAASPPLPADPAMIEALIAARADLRVAFSQSGSVPRVALLATLDALERSPVHADPQIASGIMILRGELLASDGKIAESSKLLADAYYVARAVDDPEDTLAALNGLLDNATRIRVDRKAAEQWLRTALADAERLKARSPWFATRVDLIAARMADDEEDAKGALAYIAAAQSFLRDDDPDGSELELIRGDVLMWSGKVEEGMAAYEKALAAHAAHYGPDSPIMGADLSSYATSLLAVGQAEKALAMATRGERILRETWDPGGDMLDAARVNLAAVLIGVNQDARARPLLEQARAHDVANYGEHNTLVANIDANLAVIDADRGDHAAALERLMRVLAIDEEEIGPDSLEVASRLFSIASSLLKSDRPADALGMAHRALAIYTAKSPGSALQQRTKVMVAAAANRSHESAEALAMTAEVVAAVPATTDEQELQQILAWAHLERGRAFVALKRAGEAKVDLAAARDGYTALHMPERAAEAESLQLR